MITLEADVKTNKPMFKKTKRESQLGIFSDLNLFLSGRAETFYEKQEAWHNVFRNQVTNRIDETICKPLFTEQIGAPNSSVRVLIAMMILFLFTQCHSRREKNTIDLPEKILYLNHNDTVKYVGINTCKQCHQEIYNTYIQTGMGQSFNKATKEKSSSKCDKHSVVYDKFSDFYYHPYWDQDSLKILEFRLRGKDTIYKRTEKVDYIVGSGQHTNSHLININDYIYQMPLTYYTQQGKWDLPPGFEKGFNARFSRKIGLECMSCHNAFPSFVKGSENKFNSVGNGIDCERCHGPGEIHVKEKMMGKLVDTSRSIDYSIVNPGKLPIDLQFDVCQRCHLQGNTVLQEHKSFYDFRPGMKLSDYMTVFLPKYKGAEKDFIMASHADRLKMSACFMKSFKPKINDKSLRPYKESLTCVTCHNPHVSVRATGQEVFNSACRNCHNSKKGVTCSEKEIVRIEKNDNCVSCHMPKSSAIDIPHVSITDHFIRKPISKIEVQQLKEFMGLYAVNEKRSAAKIMAKAYINQFEKFDSNPALLDSAKKYLPDADINSIKENFESLIHLCFLKKDFGRILNYCGKFEQKELLNSKAIKKSWSNDEAWTMYRIGEAYNSYGRMNDAYLFYKKTVELAPYNLDFENKYGGILVSLNKINEGKSVFEFIMKQDPSYAPAISNLGYIYLSQGQELKAEAFYNKALKLDPDYEPLLMNRAGLYIYRKQYKQAKEVLMDLLKKNPSNTKAKQVLEQLRNLN